jgi:hypothetical protein
MGWQRRDYYQPRPPGQPDISRNINEFTEVCLMVDYVIRRGHAGFRRAGRVVGWP